jgi:hypothetical protein
MLISYLYWPPSERTCGFLSLIPHTSTWCCAEIPALFSSCLLACHALCRHFPTLPNFSSCFPFILEGKGKVHPRTGHEDPQGKQTYSSTLSLTSALDGVGWSALRPGRFTPGKETRYPLYRRLGGPQGRSGQVRKISPPPGFDPRTFQPVDSRYTDWAIPVHLILEGTVFLAPALFGSSKFFFALGVQKHISALATVRREPCWCFPDFVVFLCVFLIKFWRRHATFLLRFLWAWIRPACACILS